MTPKYVCHHWLRQLLVTYSVPSHYLNQWWHIFNRTFEKKKLQWNQKWIKMQNIRFKHVACKCVSWPLVVTSNAGRIWGRWCHWKWLQGVLLLHEYMYRLWRMKILVTETNWACSWCVIALIKHRFEVTWIRWRGGNSAALYNQRSHVRIT